MNYATRALLGTLLFTTLIFAGCYGEDQSLVAKHGHIDLSEWNPVKDGLLLLNGSWEFYYNSLLFPSDFYSDKTLRKPDGFVQVPGTWRGQRVEGEKIAGTGLATYRLRIYDSGGKHQLGLKFRAIGTAYVCWVNGEFKSSAGGLGSSKKTNKPHFKPVVVPLDLRPGTNEIILHISNFHDFQGGVWEPITIGSFAHLQRQLFIATALDFFIFGSILILGIYHLFVYIPRRKESFFLFFGLFCIMLAFRSIVDGERYVYMLLQNIPWIIIFKFEYIAFILSALLFFLFIQTLLTKINADKVMLVFYVLLTVFALLVLTAPVFWFSRALNAMYLTIIVATVYVMYLLLRAALAKIQGARTTLFGTFFLFLGFLLTIAAKSLYISRYSMIYFGALIFVSLQSISFANRYSIAFTKSETLGTKLASSNRSLQRFVPQEFLQYICKKEIAEISLGDYALHKMTVLFAKIRNFSSLSEKLTPEEMLTLINSYLEHLTPIISKHKGFIGKCIDDSILALFPKEPVDACLAAVEMQQTVRVFNQQRAQSAYTPIEIGMGIHSGELMLATIGSKAHIGTSVISDAVNLASHLESLSQTFEAPILISEKIFLSIFRDLESRRITNFRLLGRLRLMATSETTSVYEIFEGCDEKTVDAKNSIKDKLENGIIYYLYKDFLRAENYFRKVLDISPHDRVALYYLGQCERCKNLAIDKEWDGSLIAE